jgi:predicted ATPase/class 3 adenylate cyclase
MDDEQRVHLETMRQVHQRRLRVLEQQAALTGTNTRPEIILEIDDLRAAIAEINATLAPSIADIPTPPAPPPARPEEQRKLVTVLRAQVNGISELMAELDPEDIADLLAELQQRGETLFARFGARSEIQSDGQLWALWGAETSREDDPEQAVRAALAVRDALAALCAEQHVELAAQIGLSTGLALVGGARGVVGEAMTLASRLAQLAPPDSILISNETYRQVRGLFDIQPHNMPGAAAKTAALVYLVTQAKTRPFLIGTRGIEQVETRMIGRDAELKALQDEYDAVAEDGERALITVVADAGLGKSRLLYEFNTWIERLPEKPLMFKGRAVPAGQPQPYALLRDLFALHFSIQDNDSAASAGENVQRGLGNVFGSDTMGRQRAQIVGHLLGFVGRESPLLKGIADDARQIYDRGIKGLTDYFQALAEKTPVVMLLEDIHWADTASLDALTLLVESLAESRLLIVCAARPSLFERRPHWGEGQPFHTRIDLRPLSPRESRKLVEAILQRLENVPSSLRDLLVNSSDGNPFYVEELIKMLIDDGIIQTGGDRWTIETEHLKLARVPTTLVGVLQARLDNLSSLEQTMLQRASVVGRIFWDATIAELGGTMIEQAVPDGSSLQQVFQTLRTRELINQRERSTFSSVQEYAFKHALLRDVTYERVLKRVRRDYHAGVAHWLAQVATEAGRADEYAPRIAEHYDQAGEAAEAAAWYGRAGKQAAARFANTDALAYLGRALELLPEAAADEQYDLLLAREKVLNLQGSRAAQLSDLEALEALADRLDDDGRRAVVTLQRASYAESTGDFPAAIEAAQRAVSLAGAHGIATSHAAGYLAWGRALLRQADYTSAQARLERARDLAEAAALPGIAADSLRVLGNVAWSQGDYPAARAAYEQALSYYSESGNRRNEGFTRSNLGTVAWKLGQYASARSSYERTLALFREIGDRGGEAMALNNLGLVLTAQTDYSGARAIYEQVLGLYRQVGNRQGESMALVNFGIAVFTQGKYSEALRAFEAALALCRTLGNRDDESQALYYIGAVSLALGDYAAARSHVEQALAIAREIGDRRVESEFLACLSLLFHQQGNHQAALATSRQALDIAQEMNDNPAQALAWRQRGHALLGAGQRNEALEAYQRAVALREELGQPNLATESLAGIALVYLAQRDIVQARAQVEQILRYLEGGTLDGTEEPFRIYLACYHVLRASRDPRAPSMLRTAVSLLRERAANIDDPAQRRSFLEQVPANRALAAAGQAAEV